MMMMMKYSNRNRPENVHRLIDQMACKLKKYDNLWALIKLVVTM